MLDPKQLRENPDAFKDAATKKGIDPKLIDAWLNEDKYRRESQAEADREKAAQRTLGEELTRLKKGDKSRWDLITETVETIKIAQRAFPNDPPDSLVLRTLGELKDRVKVLTGNESLAQARADALMLQLPAIPDPSWPEGKDDSDNVVVRSWNAPGREPAPLAAGQLDHIALGERLGLIDFDRGVKLAGSRAYVMRGAGAMLYNALLRFAMDVLIGRGWEPFVVPILVTEQCMVGTGYFPAGRDQAYVTQDGGVLVGTSEVPLASFLGGEIVEESKLPRKMCALSTCFRREAGAGGRDTAGLYRVHQFDKVEQVVVHAADEAQHVAIHEEIIANSEHILRQLGLAYRVVQNCTGDMGQGKWRMYDIETWMPSRSAYGETHSGSALRDFQSRRLNLRYRKPGEKSPTFAYTLNNTAIACPRVLIPILETYQNADGSVTVPEALRPYMNGMTTIAAG